MIILPRKTIYEISCGTRIYKFKDKKKRDEIFLTLFKNDKKYKIDDFVEIKENDFNNFISYVEELQQKYTNLQNGNLHNFIQYQQSIGQILKQVEKAGVNCEKCKYCQTVLKNGKEQKMCSYYLQKFNLPLEEIKSLCENLEIKC